MRLWKLPLVTRIIIAAVAILAIRAGSYAVPRWAATWPRIDDKAWSRAVALLRAEVGAPAIDGGAIAIPKRAISAPYRGQMLIAAPAGDMHVSFDRTGARLLAISAEEVTGALPPTAESKVAGIDPGAAREMWNVLSYLALAETRRPTGDCSSYALGAASASMRLTDRTWLKGRSRSFEAGGGADSVAGWAGRIASARFIAGIVESSDIVWSTDPKALAPALVESLRESAPPASLVDSLWATAAVNRLTPMVEVKAAPLYRRMSRLAQLRMNSQSGRLTRHEKFLMRFLVPVGLDHYGLTDASQALWAVETFGGKPEVEQLRIASAMAFDLTLTPNTKRVWAFELLRDRWPREFMALCSRKFPTLPFEERRWCLLDYRRFFGDDPSIAEIALKDDVFDMRAMGQWALYTVTRKREHLDALMALAVRPADPLQPYSRFATSLLWRLYRNDRGLSDVHEFLRRQPPTLVDSIRFAAEGSEPKDVDYLMSLVIDSTDVAIRSEAITALAGVRSSAATAALMTYLRPNAGGKLPDLSAYAIEGLGLSGSSDALSLLRKLKASGRLEAASNPAMTANGPWYGGPAGRYHIASGLSDLSVVTNLALAELEMRCAASPIDALLVVPEEIEGLLGSIPTDVLAEKYSEEELARLLAEDKYAPAAGYVYSALVSKRGERK